MLFAEWRLVFTGPADGYVNMAIDEATMTLVGERRVPPTVRIYQWDVPWCSVGYLQRIAHQKRALLRHSDLRYVRRLTGGQACLHGGDVSYSLVVSLADTLLPSDVLSSYERISAGVIEGLRLLGVDARFAPPTDVQVDVHTVATAAQARRQGVLLHQGTVALSPCSYRRLSGPVGPSLAPISDLAGGEIGPDNAAQALGMGLKRALGVDLSPGGLFAKEKRLARQLWREKYMQAEWNFAR